LAFFGKNLQHRRLWPVEAHGGIEVSGWCRKPIRRVRWFVGRCCE
jgi:hypothetical protein